MSNVTSLQFLSTNCLPSTNVRFVKGNGVTYFDDKGKEYVNFCSTTLDIARQYKNSVLTSSNDPSYIEFAQLLTNSAPDGISVVHLQYGNTIDCAIQLACFNTRRTKILCGRNYDPVQSTLSSESSITKQFNVFYSEEETLESIVELINDHHDAAAVIVEPLGISNSLYVPETIHGGLLNIRKLCSQNGIIFVIDETETFGGYIGGDLYASNHFSVSPDVICIGQCYGIRHSATLCRDDLKALTGRVGGQCLYDGQSLVSAEAIQAIKSLATDQVVQTLKTFEKATRNLKQEFPTLKICQVGFFLAITRKNGEFLENWTKRICQLSFERGLLVRNNFFKGIILSPTITIAPDVIERSFAKLTIVFRDAETELQQPSLLYSDLIKNGITPTLLTCIKKRPPVASQWEYVGALLADIDSKLFVKKVDAEQQASLIQQLRRVRIPAAEVVVTSEGCPEYAYLFGVSMETYMVNHVDTDPGMINGLVLRHQRYVEMAHDAGLCIPDRWPGNTIVANGELTLIDFDLVYYESTGDNALLFAFEEVCSTFQCVSWVKNPKLQQDLSDRLCLAVINRNKSLVPVIWKGMVKFYGNPLKPYLPESLTPDDYRKGLDAMNRSFAKLGADV